MVQKTAPFKLPGQRRAKNSNNLSVEKPRPPIADRAKSKPAKSIVQTHKVRTEKTSSN
jgi:hypothetical protein